jgi:hypothetical protein
MTNTVNLRMSDRNHSHISYSKDESSQIFYELFKGLESRGQGFQGAGK